MDLFNFDRLAGPSMSALAQQYGLAEPFPHLVLDNFVRVGPEKVLAAFPDASWPGWSDRTSRFQPDKWSCRNIEIIPDLLREMIYELSAPSFLQTLSELTGIANLLHESLSARGWPPQGELRRRTGTTYRFTISTQSSPSIDG